MKKQRGAALILFVTVMVLGVAWFAVGALGKAAPGATEREVKSGQALHAAKQALLAYAAQYAARTDHDVPGRLPCPEHRNWIGTSNEGTAWSTCDHATGYVGRLPWRTLGIDQLRDGDGEPLWYVLGPGFRDSPINFGTTAQLPYDGAANAAVALIIAPGRPLNTLADPGTPPAGCTKVNQQVAARNTATLAIANFLECGNAGGAYASLGSSQWANDRVIAVSAAEWADAIAPAVADRLQRQVAPALEEWRSVQAPANWGTAFLPYASSFGTPATNDYCGDLNQREGMLPIASAAGGACSTAWTGGTVTQLAGLLAGACGSGATEMTCTFVGLVTLPGLLTARVTATAPRVANSFRARIGSTAPDVTVSPSGSVSNFSLTLNPASGDATIRFDVSDNLLVAWTLQTITVTVKNLPDAPILSDSRLAWFTANNWHQHTYYAISEAATANPTGTCAASGDPQCLELNSVRDKRLMLALMGPRAVGTQTQPSAVPADYLESHTAGTTVYASQTVDKTFNDRLAACPFQHAGAPAALCN
jgi:hypothetical protein